MEPYEEEIILSVLQYHVQSERHGGGEQKETFQKEIDGVRSTEGGEGLLTDHTNPLTMLLKRAHSSLERTDRFRNPVVSSWLLDDSWFEPRDCKAST